MSYPPAMKRPRVTSAAPAAAAVVDPFGDDFDDFTQDDLDEIDVIASQAPPPANNHDRVQAFNPPPRDQRLPSGSTKASQSGANGRESSGSSDRQYFTLLEDQHNELKRKLKEVEEEIVLKNGEIRVLRDSLKSVQQEKETHIQSLHRLETDRQTQQSNREAELARKVQSLQSELQFKEAEMIEMKTKLHNKTTASPLQSPRTHSAIAQVHPGSSGGSSSASPTGRAFITKETFGAQLPSRSTPRRPPKTHQDILSIKSGDGPEVHPDPFLTSTRPLHLQHKGSALLSVLLQQSPGLCHLLSISPASLNTQLLHLNTSMVPSSSRPVVSRLCQLAVTGLHMMNQIHTTQPHRLCPGAIHLLPLLDFHLSVFCQALDSPTNTTNTTNTTTSTTKSSAPRTTSRPGPGVSVVGAGYSSLDGAPCGLEDHGGVGLDENGLAALRVLHVLLSYSDEVVEAVLTESKQEEQTDMANMSTDRKTTTLPAVGLQSQHTLLQYALRLCTTGCCRPRQVVVQTAVKTLCVLTERTPHTHSDRLQCVLSSGVLLVCVSEDSSVQTVSECVCVLRCVAEHEHLALQLCSQDDPCLFLNLFDYIRTRPDKRSTSTQWSELDLQVIRLINTLLTHTTHTQPVFKPTCLCYTKVVQIVVIILHRQWLEIREAEMPRPQHTYTSGQREERWQPVVAQARSCSPGVNLLRESLVLLHWLLLNHSGFSESVRAMLHMYDQVIPALRDTLRTLPDLTYTEELALEEVCRPESDFTDAMDTDC